MGLRRLHNPEMTDSEPDDLRPASAVPKVVRMRPKRGRQRAEAVQAPDPMDHSISSGSASTTRRARS
jgi:hypothetical protein